MKSSSLVDVNVHVLIPSSNDWCSRFGLSLALLTSYFALARVVPESKKQRLSIINMRGSMLSQLRESLLKGALMQYKKGTKSRPTHVLLLDSDMVFPRDALHRLMRHNVAMVGVNYTTKEIPAKPTAVLEDERTYLYTDPNSTGLVRVGHIGLGVVLINMDVVNHIAQPWFPMKWNEESRAYVGEDVAFCHTVTEAGYDIYVDQDLSKEVKHVGELCYSHELVGEVVEEQTPFVQTK